MKRSWPLKYCWLLASVACWLSCRPPLTEVVLRVSTNMSQGPTGKLRAIRVAIINSTTGRASFDQTVALAASADSVRLPSDVMGISPANNQPTRPLVVEVTAVGERGAI